MRWNKHSHLEGQHSFLSPSYYHWVNYDLEKLAARYRALQAAQEGVAQHQYAAVAIQEKEFQDNETTTLGMYINQCIQYRMTPEVVLYYSPNAYGTVDAIAYRYRILRISDLKTGDTRTSEWQLIIYAAYFCLEYEIDPFSMRKIELRIYQHNQCRPYLVDPAVVKEIMDKIVLFDKRLNELHEEVS